MRIDGILMLLAIAFGSYLYLHCPCIQTYVNETYILVDQMKESECELHYFSVIAMDEAGNSTPSTIMESIPLSKTLHSTQ